jgi:hypothetical protein
MPASSTQKSGAWTTKFSLHSRQLRLYEASNPTYMLRNIILLFNSPQQAKSRQSFTRVVISSIVGKIPWLPQYQPRLCR